MHCVSRRNAAETAVRISSLFQLPRSQHLHGCVYFVLHFLGPVQGNFWVMRFVRRGTPNSEKKKVALASPARIHVDEMDVCEIPIGRDDTGRSAVWLLYREWPYQRKKARQKCAKTLVK